ncbi:MAG: SHOCT domain-containing protein [Ignavibacteriales bacterium]|nr:SHOCT domain-containing protein [Ignavibacteriales bacterium]
MMWNSGCSWWWGPGYFFGGPFGMIIGIVFWALVAYAIFRLILNVVNRSFVATKSEKPLSKEETAMEILKRRYAKGEIDGEEFTRRKKDLAE